MNLWIENYSALLSHSVSPVFCVSVVENGSAAFKLV